MDGTAATSEITNTKRMVSEELKPSWISNENRCGTSDQKNSLLDVEVSIDNSVTLQVGSLQSNDIETGICKESKWGEGSGKRLHTRWDELPEKCNDGESVADEKSRKKRKTRWDNAENHDLNAEVEAINKKLQCELIKRRQHVVSELVKKQPTFRTPPKYRRFKFLKKIYVPVKQYPLYNFAGLILGPRGNSLKKMQSETGSRINLRGLGSSSRGTSHDFDNDDLHVRIEADDEESFDAAVKMVEKLMVPTDDGSNEYKQAQLKELATLKQCCKEVNRCYVCSGDQEHGCTCDSESNDTARDEALLKRAHLFVDQLPKNIEDRHFREFFCPFGNLLETKVTRCGKKNKNRRCGYVKFENANDAAEAALSLKGFKYKGMWICRVGGRLVLGSEVLPKAKAAGVTAETGSSALDFGIFISNLPECIDNSRLKELSCPFGRIVNARVIRDRKWRSKGCGVVEFEDHEDAAAALSHLNGFELEGKVLTVVATRDQASSTGGSGSSFQNYSGQSVDSSSGYGARFPGDPDCLGSQMFDFEAQEIEPPHLPEEGNVGPISWPTIYHPM